MAESVEQAGQLLSGADDTPLTRLADRGDRLIWAGLGCAVLLHASFLLGMIRLPEHVIGDTEGSSEALSVSLVTEAEFLAQNSAPPQQQAAPGKPADQVAPQAPAPTPPTPEPPKPREQTAEPTPPAPPPEEQKAEPQKAEPQETATAEEPPKRETKPPTSIAALEDDGLLSLEPVPKSEPAPKSEHRPEPKPREAKPAQKPPQQTASLEPPPAPSQSFSAPPVAGGGRAGSFARPPGITKSGWNDAFARAVIRALQMTMPQMRALGRVTVRILLDNNGNVGQVQVVKPSPDSNLNQSVVFAARQTSYPIPPVGATVADRTFLVTYIYN